MNCYIGAINLAVKKKLSIEYSKRRDTMLESYIGSIANAGINKWTKVKVH